MCRAQKFGADRTCESPKNVSLPASIARRQSSGIPSYLTRTGNHSLRGTGITTPQE